MEANIKVISSNSWTCIAKVSPSWSKPDRVLNCLSSLIVDETKRNIICKDAQSLKDVHDLSLGEIDCTIINNFSKKSDIKILSDILETCDNFQEVAVLLKRKLLEFKEIHLGVLDCSCSMMKIFQMEI